MIESAKLDIFATRYLLVITEMICLNQSKVCFLNEVKLKGSVCHERPRTIFKLIPAICTKAAFRWFALHANVVLRGRSHITVDVAAEMHLKHANPAYTSDATYHASLQQP